MQIRPTLSHALIALLLGMLLSACTPLPTQPEVREDPDIERAAGLLAEQQFLEASTLYEALARRTPGDVGTDFLLDAIDSAIKGTDLDRAAELLQRTDGRPLNATQQLRQGLLRAELDLAHHQGDLALDTLLGLIRPDMPDQMKLRHLRDLATAYRQVGNLLESANALQQLDTRLGDRKAERLAVQSEILRALTALNERTLKELQPTPPGIPGGWMELALLIKQHRATPATLPQALQQWRERFPEHPALPELLQQFSERLRSQVEQVDHIAILLPQRGRYAPAARLLRDGIMAAYYQLPEEQRPLLRFYDSSDPYSAWPLYTQAVEAGAEAIIGPLQKESVSQLLRAGELAVPALALNQVLSDTAPPANFHMFSLDPEQEARLAAERIWQDGLRHPVMLTPNNHWGERLRDAFSGRWQALTGEAVEGRAYAADSADYSQPISSLMHLDLSKARHKRLQQWLGQRIGFEPRRRHDIDAVLVAARPQQAQSIRPQLAFFRAGDLPMYTTSHAWSGSLTVQQLADMRGILLPDIPLLADRAERERLGQLLPGILGPGVRLYAMGMDALHLLPHLKRLQDSPYESLDGQTGNLFMDPEHQIRRQLVWLRLDEPPEILGYSARMNLEPSSETASGQALETEPDTTGEATDPEPRKTATGAAPAN